MGGHGQAVGFHWSKCPSSVVPDWEAKLGPKKVKFITARQTNYKPEGNKQSPNVKR